MGEQADTEASWAHRGLVGTADVSVRRTYQAQVESPLQSLCLVTAVEAALRSFEAAGHHGKHYHFLLLVVERRPWLIRLAQSEGFA